MRGKCGEEQHCRYNKGVLCSLAGRECTCCGWSPKEDKRRKSEIKGNGLTVNSKGKLFLKLRKADAE